MAARCVYTGALVYFIDFDMEVRGDLFEVGDHVLIQWGQPGSQCEDAITHGNARLNEHGQSQATHTAVIGNGYHHPVRGITVVERRHFEGEFR